MNFRDKYGNHWLCYSELCNLRKSFQHYEEVYEELYAVHNLYEFFDKLNFLSKETKIHMKKFQDKWYQYINANDYSNDRVFVYFDEEFLSLLDIELKDFLINFNNDLLQEGYSDIESLEIEKREFPDGDAILERGRTLYGLLIKNNIISN